MMRVNLVLPEGYAFKWQTIRRKLRTRFEHDSMHLAHGFQSGKCFRLYLVVHLLLSVLVKPA